MQYEIAKNALGLSPNVTMSSSDAAPHLESERSANVLH